MLRLFLVSSAVLTTLYYIGTRSGPHPLPIWPDSIVIGSSVAALVTLIVWRFKTERQAARHLGNLSRTLWPK